MKFELHENMSPQEQFQRLLDGETLYTRDVFDYFIMMTDRGAIIEMSGGNSRSYVDGMNKPRDVYLSVKPKWYEEIPEGGRLCRVWDKENSPANCVAVVLRYDEGERYEFRLGADQDAIGFKHAEPLTNEEIKAFLTE